MRWVGTGFAIGLLLVIAGYAVGLFLPVTYQAAASRVIDASRNDVWQEVRDFQSNPVSAKMAKDVSALETDDDVVTWVEDIGSSRLTVRTISSDPKRSITREVNDNVVPMHGKITVRLTERDGKTTVHVANETHIYDGTWHVPLFRLSMQFTDALEVGIADYLDQLEANLAEPEATEEVEDTSGA